MPRYRLRLTAHRLSNRRADVSIQRQSPRPGDAWTRFLEEPGNGMADYEIEAADPDAARARGFELAQQCFPRVWHWIDHDVWIAEAGTPGFGPAPEVAGGGPTAASIVRVELEFIPAAVDRYPQDIARMRAILNARGYDAPDRDIAQAHAAFCLDRCGEPWVTPYWNDEDGIFLHLMSRLSPRS